MPDWGNWSLLGVPVPGVPVIVPVAVIATVAVDVGPAVGGARTAVAVGAGVSVAVGATAGARTRVAVATATRTVGDTAVVWKTLGIIKIPPTATNPSRSKPTKPMAITTKSRLGPPPAGAISAMF